MHRIEHVVEAPIMGADGIIGALHFAATEHPFTPEQLALAEAVAGVLAETLERIAALERRERERAQLAAALDLTATAVVTSAPDTRMNPAARRLLADVEDAEEHLLRLLARPAAEGSFSRRTGVALAGGGAAVLEAASMPVADGLVTVLELRREAPAIAPGALGVLTPREAEVAVLVSDGLADREIAQRLYLSHHTVGQHIKRIYRKLDVDSRVALTRLLLAPQTRGL
jgi:DNA-binding CsgD family transcriptional regulator